MPRLSNFTDRQKADLFVRDRATCAYSGRNLWLLDHGLDPYFQVDWADHVVPVAKGGLSTLENGVCASWEPNFEKGSNAEPYPRLYQAGAPTTEFTGRGQPLSRAIEARFTRFSALHYSDWYLNRAFCRLWWGVAYLADTGSRRSRDDAYYARASFKILEQWKRIVAKLHIASLEDRGLASRCPTPEQQLLLTVRDAASVRDIREAMARALPFYVGRE